MCYQDEYLRNYGFNLLTTEESIELGLPNSMGSFEELYKSMEEEYKTKRLQKKRRDLENTHNVMEKLKYASSSS